GTICLASIRLRRVVSSHGREMKALPKKRTPPRWRAHTMLLAMAAGSAHAAPTDLPAEAAAEPLPVIATNWADESKVVAAVKGTDTDPRPFKSYGAAAAEILGFQVLLNRFDNRFEGDDYRVSMGTIRRNLHHSWVEDHDSFEINQMGHPYQGSVYFGLARSNGLSFWESLGYAFGASAVWEIAGENTPPSRNDQITTSFGGSFLGESFYRMANLVLEQGDLLTPRWREAAAAAISPSLGFNRHVGGGRAVPWSSHDPAIFSRFQLGVGLAAHGNVGTSLVPKRNEAAADFALEYGLPGKPGYTYHRPFDYFLFRLRVSNDGVESLASRGLLLGAPYEGGASLRGVAGLYGSYDYLSPQQFRVASTGLSLGTNLQWRIAASTALQAHVSAGYGYTSTGTVRASSSREYTYGYAPQAMMMLRLIHGDRLTVDLVSRGFFDGRLARQDTSVTDGVVRGDASVTYRVSGPHAVTLKYITSRRRYSFLGGAGRQRLDTVGLYYTYQVGRGTGAVKW
ncbi:MAG: DUF3943 domain-containing protein, partial [Ramlibacter sp.]